MTAKTTRKLSLSNVTLCAAASVNVASTIRALVRSLEIADFGNCLLFTDITNVRVPNEIEIVKIDRLRSVEDYSNFILKALPDHIETSHCLISQWDGHLLSAEHWQPTFLEYDYIGAKWPQFKDGYDVGNGGFSLRSKRLMTLCRDPEFVGAHPEDVAVCRTNRAWLEGEGMRFAPASVADSFSCERTGDISSAFGYHGGFNIPLALGVDKFWAIYEELDDCSSLRPDFTHLVLLLARGPRPFSRVTRFVLDRVLRW